MHDNNIKIGIEIHKVDHMMKRMVAYRAKSMGMDEVTLMHGWIIQYLYENKDREVFQKDIETHFSVGRSTVTNIIQLMEKKGYIARQSVEYDARLKRVILTDIGFETQNKMDTLAEQLDQMFIEGVSEEEMEVFYKVMNKIKMNAQKGETNV